MGAESGRVRGRAPVKTIAFIKLQLCVWALFFILPTLAVLELWSPE
jgi:cytochrome c oxidase subunit IV